MKPLSSISDWKDFERLTADLLQAEGFLIESEPKVDRTGIDVTASCEYRPHNDTAVPSIRIRWLVQCKHYAKSRRTFARAEMEQALVSYGAIAGPNEGLLLVLSSDYSEPAHDVLQRFRERNPARQVLLWNSRQIVTLLERHPHLIRRYHLQDPPAPPFAWRSTPAPKVGPVLVVSDQSALAHDFANWLRASGSDVTVLSHWNYSDINRLRLCTDFCRNTRFELCALFLGDTFEQELPPGVRLFVSSILRRGASLLLFPFVAWSIAGGANDWLADLSPVRLSDKRAAPTTPIDMDFSGLLLADDFAEASYREYDPADGEQLILTGVDTRFGLSHSFEYLAPVTGALVSSRDTTGNPFVVTRDTGSVRVAYVNTCCHSCIAPVAVASPLAVSPEFGTLMSNTVTWLVREST